MARINRSDVIQKAVNDLALSTSEAKVIPNETLDKVQLTYSLNKQFSSIVAAATQATTGSFSITLPTVSTGGETYLTSIVASAIKDATCDVATGALQVSVTPDGSGISTVIIRIPVITLTAQSEGYVLPLPYPLKVRNGSSVTITGTFTVGVMSRSISVTGFTSTSN